MGFAQRGLSVSEKSQISSVVKNLSFIVLMIAVIGGGIMFCNPIIKQLHGLQNQRDEQDREIRDLEAEIQSLKTKQQRFKNDPSFVEFLAREARQAQPGELVFVFNSEQR